MDVQDMPKGSLEFRIGGVHARLAPLSCYESHTGTHLYNHDMFYLRLAIQ